MAKRDGRLQKQISRTKTQFQRKKKYFGCCKNAQIPLNGDE